MGMTTAGKNMQANAIAYDLAKLHTADPTDAGTVAEISTTRTQKQIDAGKPAYAAKAITHAAAVNGLRVSDSPVFDIPEGTTVKFYSLWAAGVCVLTSPVENEESYGGVGIYTLNDADGQTN